MHTDDAGVDRAPDRPRRAHYSWPRRSFGGNQRLVRKDLQLHGGTSRRGSRWSTASTPRWLTKS
jgi:hypothetical protein